MCSSDLVRVLSPLHHQGERLILRGLDDLRQRFPVAGSEPATLLDDVAVFHARALSRFFFFQAEDGIRVRLVTGVQTCALPISTKTIGVVQRMASFMAKDAEAPTLASAFDFQHLFAFEAF